MGDARGTTGLKLRHFQRTDGDEAAHAREQQQPRTGARIQPRKEQQRGDAARPFAVPPFAGRLATRALQEGGVSGCEGDWHGMTRMLRCPSTVSKRQPDICRLNATVRVGASKPANQDKTRAELGAPPHDLSDVAARCAQAPRTVFRSVRAGLQRTGRPHRTHRCAVHAGPRAWL